MAFNTFRITLGSFLAYFVMSAIITPLGIVSQPIASSYGVELTTATAVFSSLTSGIFIGSIVALFIFDRMTIKQVVLLSALLIALSLLTIRILDSFFALSVMLFFTGLGCGIALSTAAAVITEAYTEKFRPSMLLLTDSFYSGAGTISTALGVYLLSQGWHWWGVYLLAFGTLILLMVLALPSSYPQKSSSEAQTESLFGWPPAIYLCGLSLLFYLLGVVTLYSWLPNYAHTEMGLPVDEAGNLVGRFFSGMFFGQLVMFFLVLKLPIRSLITVCLLGASLLTILLWQNTEILKIQTTALLLGFVGGGVFKVVVAYGTTLLINPSPKVVSYLLFNTSLGTAIAPALSAWVVEMGGMTSAMSFTSLCYFMALGFLLLTFMAAKRTPTTA